MFCDFIFLTELPDVGNWFSSYDYRSPDPDSNFNLEDSDFRIRESQRDGFDKVRVQDEGVVRKKIVQCNGTCVKVDNHSEDPCLTKVNIFSQLFIFESEILMH